MIECEEKFDLDKKHEIVNYLEFKIELPLLQKP
jgi:hypothetical protein